METQTLPSPYASLGSRVIAFIIDAIIGGVLGVIGAHLIPVLGAILVWFFYAPILEASAARATIGKHLMGIEVADLNGDRITLKASLLRNLLKIVSTVFLFIGFVFAFFGSKKQTLHDLVADTLVINGRSSVPLADAWMTSTKELFRSGATKFEETTGWTPADPNNGLVEQLERLRLLHEQGALTEVEYQLAKKKLLG